MIPDEPGLTGGYIPPDPLSVCAPPTEGFPSGTLLMTGDGAIPVEFLSPGDRIVTRDAGMMRLLDMQSGIATLPAVAVAPGALGQIERRAPVILPATQKVLLRDWRARALAGRDAALIALAALVDGEFIRALGPRRMVLHHLRFAERHIVYADGIEAAAWEDQSAAPAT